MEDDEDGEDVDIDGILEYAEDEEGWSHEEL
jgi:hypothetical protein